MLKELIISIQGYFDAYRLVKDKQLWKWIIIPGVINSLLLVVFFYYFMSSYNEATRWIFDKINLRSWLEHSFDSWLNFLFIMGKVFLDILLIFACFSFYKFFFLIIASPVFSLLSEKSNQISGSSEFIIESRVLSHDIIRGIKVSVKNLCWQFIYIIGLLLLSIIPIAGWISPLLLISIDCYFLGFSMLDYSNERKKLGIAQSADLISHHRGLAIGNGLIFYLLHLVPVLGWIFAPGFAVIAATLSLHRAQEQKLIHYPNS